MRPLDACVLVSAGPLQVQGHLSFESFCSNQYCSRPAALPTASPFCNKNHLPCEPHARYGCSCFINYEKERESDKNQINFSSPLKRHEGWKVMGRTGRKFLSSGEVG
jgi:hypothetical protein